MAGRVKDIDRQYERNNNADLDNGVYHKVDEQPKEHGPPNAVSDTFGQRKKDLVVLLPPRPLGVKSDIERFESLIQLQEENT
jgi:hypothetical protein